MEKRKKGREQIKKKKDGWLAHAKRLRGGQPLTRSPTHAGLYVFCPPLFFCAFFTIFYCALALLLFINYTMTLNMKNKFLTITYVFLTGGKCFGQLCKYYYIFYVCVVFSIGMLTKLSLEYSQFTFEK